MQFSKERNPYKQFFHEVTSVRFYSVIVKANMVKKFIKRLKKHTYMNNDNIRIH